MAIRTTERFLFMTHSSKIVVAYACLDAEQLESTAHECKIL
jgi:hypothetical protein